MATQAESGLALFFFGQHNPEIADAIRACRSISAAYCHMNHALSKAGSGAKQRENRVAPEMRSGRGLSAVACKPVRRPALRAMPATGARKKAAPAPSNGCY